MIRRVLTRFAAVAAAFSVLACSFGFASESLLQRTAVLITSPNVALDMKLTKAQIATRNAIVNAFQESREAIVKRMQSGPAAEMDARQAELEKAQADMDAKLLGLLSQTQQGRLKQIAIQQVGIEALQEDAIANDLGLTAAQKTKINAIFTTQRRAQESYDLALSDAIAKLPEPGEGEAAMAAYVEKQKAIVKSMKPREKVYLNAKTAGNKQILAIMTPAQRTKWATMRGKPLKAG